MSMSACPCIKQCITAAAQAAVNHSLEYKNSLISYGTGYKTEAIGSALIGSGLAIGSTVYHIYRKRITVHEESSPIISHTGKTSCDLIIPAILSGGLLAAGFVQILMSLGNFNDETKNNYSLFESKLDVMNTSPLCDVKKCVGE